MKSGLSIRETNVQSRVHGELRSTQRREVPQRGRKLSRGRREFLLSVVAILPALAFFGIFSYYPILLSMFYAFTDWNGYGLHFHFVGLANFLTIFQERDNLNAFGNTLYLGLLAVGIGFPLQMFFAVLLSNLRGGSIFKAIMYLPALLSGILVAYTWTSLLQYTGIYNTFVQHLGLKNLVVDWLGDPNIVKIALTFINTWQFTGYGMLILLAGMSSIPEDIQNAARIDGADAFRRFWHVTFPLMMPAITVNLFLGLSGALRIFDLPFLMTNGGPRDASTTVVYSIYNNAFEFNRFGVSSSMGLLFGLFIALVTLIQLSITRRRELEY